MLASSFSHWISALENNTKRPAYLLIADLIEADIESGRLLPQDRLPTLRTLASHLRLNYTTIARAYSEAQKRGILDSNRRGGSFVKGKSKTVTPPEHRQKGVDMTMNLPPEAGGQSLLAKIHTGVINALSDHDIYPVHRCRGFCDTAEDKKAAYAWISRFVSSSSPEQILVCPGIHSVLVALFSQLAGKKGAVAVQNLVYPGIKAIAAQLGVTLITIDSDINGPLLEPLETLCKAGKLSALYLNPTIQNPTALTISRERRESIAELALRYNLPLIEDDAYGMLPKSPVVPLADLAPGITYYISGLSKCFSAGLRIGFLHAPNKLLAQRTAGALRALTVMASPVICNLVNQWIMDGTIDAMLAAIRDESRARQKIAQRYFSKATYYAHEYGFHLWLTLPPHMQQNPTALAAHLRANNISAVSSSAFCTDNSPPDAIRLCLGGPTTQRNCEEALQLVSDMLEHPEQLNGLVL